MCACEDDSLMSGLLAPVGSITTPRIGACERISGRPKGKDGATMYRCRAPAWPVIGCDR